MQPAIRLATTDDVDAIFEVMLDLFTAEDAALEASSSALKAQLRERRPDFDESARADIRADIEKDDHRYLVAEHDGRIVAYAHGDVKEQEDAYLVQRRYGDVDALVVLEAYRGRGLGTRLHDERVEWFRERGCTHLILTVLENNPAHALYENWGYIDVDRRMIREL